MVMAGESVIWFERLGPSPGSGQIASGSCSSSERKDLLAVIRRRSPLTKISTMKAAPLGILYRYVYGYMITYTGRGIIQVSNTMYIHNYIYMRQCFSKLGKGRKSTGCFTRFEVF